MATGNIDQQDSIGTLGGFGMDEDENDSSAMTLVEHLEELRKRIFVSLIAIVVGGIIAFIFRVQIMQFLTLPLPHTADAIGHGKLVVTGLAEGFTVFLKLAFAVGFVIALPVILYEVWAFIKPGLYPQEKKHAVPFIFIGLILFVAGIALGYIVLQYPVQWLVNFGSTSFTELVTADSYFTFVAFFLLAFGIVFEIPLILTFLSVIGLVSADTLKRRRAYSHVGMWVAATFLTPGADIYSPIILGIAMSCLYELTILFIWFTKRGERAQTA
jgi:sec-independent protein translocase protein TatC